MDRYGWLREWEHPEVCAYLEAENNYAEQATTHLTDLKAELIAEIEGRRTCEGDAIEFQLGPFEYFQKPERGLFHPAWWRRAVTGGPAQLVLDPNAIPGAEVFYSLGVFEPSDDGRYLAFSFDLIGDEGHELRVRDIESGRDVWRDSGRAAHVIWAADGNTLFFARERIEPRRCDKVVRLAVETGTAEVIFEEANEFLDVRVRRSDSGAWLFLDVITTCNYSVQQGAAEVWCLPADDPRGEWRRIVTRALALEVFAEHWKDRFVFRVNDTGPGRRLVSAPIDNPSTFHWKEVVPHRADVTLEEVHVLEHHLVVVEREGLRPRLVSRDANGSVRATHITDEASCTLTVGVSARGYYSVPRHAFRTATLVCSVSSFVTPNTVIEYDLDGCRSTLLSRACVQGYDAAKYAATVLIVQAEDGAEIPVSLVARHDWVNPGPVILRVYGCYGKPIWPSFNPARLSLLDRGVAFGFVHLRGGGEFGRPWHEAAMGNQKRTTYTDLIAVAEGLVKRGLARQDGVAIEGKSAGGGTVLAAAALRPDLFRAVLAEVPLADILDTELDFSMPYAFQETVEYGNPRVFQEYRYLRTYDPYYNLSADRLLPPTYVDTALNDSQALCHQAARYVAQRRSCAADRDPKLVFRVRKVGGHSGASHGPDVAENAAFRIAWVLDQLRCSGS
ncbi:prolyl oligopeptidase family serine peptidase [Mesorhizobium sp. M0965]